jgi:hypothetical protein
VRLLPIEHRPDASAAGMPRRGIASGGLGQTSSSIAGCPRRS